MHDLLPRAARRVPRPAGTEWDAPLDGEPCRCRPCPRREVFDLRGRPRCGRGAPASIAHPRARADAEPLARAEATPGRVAGAHTANGAALVANDMHLGLDCPTSGTAPRSSGRTRRERERRVTGVTLPGAPMIVAGSNGHVAWGFTNARSTARSGRARDGSGTRRPLPRRRTAGASSSATSSTIEVRGASEPSARGARTIWGPVLDRDHRGRRRALRWVAHDAGAVDLGLLATGARARPRRGARCRNAARHSARRTASSPIARAASAGRSPGRFRAGAGFDGRMPASWADGARGWDGCLDPAADYPRLVDPPAGRIWTREPPRRSAARMLGRSAMAGFDLGARARQIRDDLSALERATAQDLLGAAARRPRAVPRALARPAARLDAEAVAADPRRAELRRLGRARLDRPCLDRLGRLSHRARLPRRARRARARRAGRAAAARPIPHSPARCDVAVGGAAVAASCERPLAPARPAPRELGRAAARPPMDGSIELLAATARTARRSAPGASATRSAAATR